mmetsp:Transcript_31704/g.92995  ORF Transcript_31704/g.92995 Transcript_31704/m.92995 type:complete len:371 (-) Transcript_31704:736-1848(-)
MLQRSEALEDVLKLSGSDVAIDVAQIDLLGDFALPADGTNGNACRCTRSGGRRGWHHGGIRHGRPAGGAGDNASTSRHGPAKLALESLGDGTSVVLLGLAALHQDGEALEVGNLRTELEGDGDVGKVGHLDVGTSLVPAGALVAEEDDLPNAASPAAEVLLDVALVGLHYQLGQKDGPLFLGEMVGLVLDAGRARTAGMAAVGMAIALVRWEVARMPRPPVVGVMRMVRVPRMTRLSAATIRSVPVATAARALPVMTLLGPRPRPRAGARRTTRGGGVGTPPFAATAILGGGLALVVAAGVGAVLGRAGRRLVSLLLAATIGVTILALVSITVGSLGCFLRRAAAGSRSRPRSRPRPRRTTSAATSRVGP